MPKVKGKLRKLARIADLEKERVVYEKARHFLSLGGGMQSTALFVGSVLNRYAFPIEAAIFADTGWERPQTYETIRLLTAFGAVHGVPVYTVRSGNIYEDALNPEVRAPGMPFYVRPLPITVEEQRDKLIASFDDPDTLFSNLPESAKEQALSDFDARAARGEVRPIEKKGSVMLERQCTGDYKIKPVRAKLRELVKDSSFKNPVCLWIGITTDEIGRMKPADVKWVKHRWPLIEQRKSRQDCVDFLKNAGFPIPVKSSCIGCPFHTAREWDDLNEEEFESACEFDETIRQQGLTHPTRNPEAVNRLYLHRDLVPLRQRPYLRQLKNKETPQMQLVDGVAGALSAPEEEPGCDSWGCFT